jgi:NTP pyrophosphatase (non-canonical NTP hydrolase)
MTMSADGLNKLMEECGELIQIAAKKAAYPNTEIHPDGQNINHALEAEIADVLAACEFVTVKLGLDRTMIDNRAHRKLMTYNRWDADPNL